MSINQLFNTTRQSFQAFTAAMNTIGENVANAGSEGYSRRRIGLSAQSVVSQGLFTRSTARQTTGAGVSVSVYERLRDSLLSRSAWHANAWMGASEEEHRVVTTLQSIFTVQTEGSLSNQLDSFWNAWSDVADNPAANGVRLALRNRAASLADTLNRMAADVEHLRGETVRTLSAGIDDVNKILSEVAELNEIIARGNHLGSPDLGAEDRRDVLVNRLSEYANVRVQEEKDGSYTVTLDGMMLIGGKQARLLSLDTSGATPSVLVGGTPVQMKIPPEGGGRLVGWLRTLTSTLPDTIGSLDNIAETLVKQINALHEQGFDLDGNTGVRFFHYEAGPPEKGILASSIRLSDAVQANSRAIVASEGDPSDGVNDSAIANEILRLRESKLMNGGTETLETYGINLVTDVGARSERASKLYESHAAFAAHLDAMARGVSGVSLEEEMTNLIQFQQSFAAAARVLNTAQDMMNTLLNI